MAQLHTDELQVQLIQALPLTNGRDEGVRGAGPRNCDGWNADARKDGVAGEDQVLDGCLAILQVVLRGRTVRAPRPTQESFVSERRSDEVQHHP
eukprot:CAMPEP_0198121286 /NCGR_PEP_ID=MMETSP1442-20131203/31675_1 /TAXON_ID= /ORGANISM="Craspedostauros australis, Strain CCMP3328" /LENGTH=93 /DNA_ID=CAMNT_0043780067 /DNA_START=10 /DNA_END=287 /DNA_ORIENTATION=+